MRFVYLFYSTVVRSNARTTLFYATGTTLSQDIEHVFEIWIQKRYRRL